MHTAPEHLSLDRLEKCLSTRVIGRGPHASEVCDSLPSTNTRVAELAVAGAPEGVFVAARQQTAGRGRLGRTWVSPPDAGIYVSVLLRPQQALLSQLAPITLATGVAVSKAIEFTTGIRLGLKWVNDLVFEGRKVGGILAEMPGQSTSANHPHKALIIGIGINVRQDKSKLPDELKDKINWLEQIAGEPLDPNQIAARILLEVENAYLDLSANGASSIMKEWRARSVTLGREIIASSGNTSIEGVAIDIDDNGALIVRTADNTTRELHAGEITIRTADGKYT
ncbi:MAG TPA: biotin--[acetyl-CoA-carboxylase] ligase [Planktothrix sp.]|jgi:BirA family biotin operon repressor/biotin-[acetyl-CoA-carboxylase] ligase